MSQGSGALSFGYGSALAAAIQLPMAQRWDSLNLAAGWKPGLSGLQHRDVTILHRTLGEFGVCFASTDCNRTFLGQTNTPKSCLVSAPGSTR